MTEITQIKFPESLRSKCLELIIQEENRAIEKAVKQKDIHERYYRKEQEREKRERRTSTGLEARHESYMLMMAKTHVGKDREGRIRDSYTGIEGPTRDA